MGLFGKIFGSKKKTNSVEGLVADTLENLIEKGRFDLQFEIKMEKAGEDKDLILIQIKGNDKNLLKDREGQMLDSIQLFLKRVIQHNFPEDQSDIEIDCEGFREETTKELIELAEKLKLIAIEKERSVYCRALPPRDRKVVHQYLSEDQRVKSRSIGEGVFKKIKIYPAKATKTEETFETDQP